MSYYEDKPVELKGQVELVQRPIEAAAGVRSVEGAVRTTVVYVEVPSETGPFLVPFADYDDWSLRDRYNEAIRIMNTLGAATIECQTFREVKSRKKLRALVKNKGPKFEQQRIENSGFDFRHSGAGSGPAGSPPPALARRARFRCGGQQRSRQRSDQRRHQHQEQPHTLRGRRAGLTLSKVGFELGGSAEHSGATSLHISAGFPQPKKLWK